jgi:hypothetical protein
MKMRRLAVALTILMGTHAAYVHYAQYGGGFSNRYLPRPTRPYEYDRPHGPEDRIWLTPRHRWYQHEFQMYDSLGRYRRGPYRPY